ncbi:MAG: class I SAM-dependent methyltransferase [Mycobacterium sp.]
MTDVSELRSVRTAGDSWEITESVGSTALGVAACRAIETARAHPLIRDELAQLLVSAAGPAWSRMADPQMDWCDDDFSRREFESACDYQAVRTHFFDEYFTAASSAGIQQIVILASGLDARPYRLQWPAGTVVFEIDQPKVLSYKAATLQTHGITPSADHRPVGIDLRDDWAAALVGAGFDRSHRTAWLAEGLLPYLPADAQDRLFDTVTQLSAPGSRIAVEAFTMNGTTLSQERLLARRERQARMRTRLAMDVDVETLFYTEPDRADANRSLAEHGWQVQSVSSGEEMARLGRPVPSDLAEESVSSELITAELPSGLAT